jgi:hypothetical protein
MPQPTLAIELTSPQTVNGQAAPYQSLWLLARLLHAHRAGSVVRLDDLRGQVSSASTLRMVISRAFRDFKTWGVQVGWGEDQSREPRFLNAEGRSQGPFWLPAREARRLRLRVDGRAATPAEAASFLGLATRRARKPGPVVAAPDAVHLQDAQFWQQLVAAQQAMRQGRWSVGLRDGSGTSALQAMRAAGALAGSDFQRALVVLNEALLWRRLGDDGQARKRVAALQRQRLAQHVAGHEYLGAMAAIVGAWCSYTARDLPLAQGQLEAIARDPAHAPLLRHHPHVRFEWSNLWALVCRSRALLQSTPDRAQALGLADESMQQFGQALAAAFESHSFDAAQHVAANMGMAQWLFARVGLTVDDVDTQRRAVQWIAFSEWLSDQTDTQHRSAWNAIYLLRIARGGCRVVPGTTLATFQQLRPLTRSALADLAGALAGAFAHWPERPLDMARALLDAHASGRQRYPGLQWCSLLFEHAWYAAQHGDLRAAAGSLAQLREQLPQLVASDRAYFRDVWNDELPVELLTLEPPPRRAARRTR